MSKRKVLIGRGRELSDSTEDQVNEENEKQKEIPSLEKGAEDSKQLLELEEAQDNSKIVDELLKEAEEAIQKKSVVTPSEEKKQTLSEPNSSIEPSKEEKKENEIVSEKKENETVSEKKESLPQTKEPSPSLASSTQKPPSSSNPDDIKRKKRRQRMIGQNRNEESKIPILEQSETNKDYYFPTGSRAQARKILSSCGVDCFLIFPVSGVDYTVAKCNQYQESEEFTYIALDCTDGKFKFRESADKQIYDSLEDLVAKSLELKNYAAAGPLWRKCKDGMKSIKQEIGKPKEDEIPPEQLSRDYADELDLRTKVLRAKISSNDYQIKEQSAQKIEAVEKQEYESAALAKEKIEELEKKKKDLEEELAKALKKLEKINAYLKEHEPEEIRDEDEYVPVISVPQKSTFKKLDYKAISNQMQEKDSGLVMQPKKNKRVNKFCFTGSDGTDWLMQKLEISRPEAIRIGQALMASGTVGAVEKGLFSDKEKDLFFFQDLTEFFQNRNPVLHVHVADAVNLVARETSSNTEPYLVFKWGTEEKKTKTSKNHFCPDWNETFKIPVTDLSWVEKSPLHFTIYDKNSSKKGQHLGTCKISIASLVSEEETHFSKVKLEGVATGALSFSLTARDFGHPDKLSSLNYQLLHFDPKTENAKEKLIDLIEAGADPNCEDDDRNGMSPLHIQANRDSPSQILQILLEKGANVEKRDDLGRTPLHHAVINCAQEHAKLLLKFGADPLAKDKDGKAPIHFAGSYKLSHIGEKNPCLPILVQYPATINTIDKNGDTPLHWAARIGNKTTTTFLLEHGGKESCQIKNNQGKLPVQEGLFDLLSPFSFQ